MTVGRGVAVSRTRARFDLSEELHPRVHHHILHTRGCDLRLQFVENDMVNHQGAAHRRFQGAAQVRMHAERSTTARPPS